MIKIPVEFKLAVRNVLRHPVSYSLIGFIIMLSSVLFLVSGAISNNSQKSWRTYLSSTLLGHYNVGTLAKNERDYTLPAFKLPGTYIEGELIDYLNKNKIIYSMRIRTGAAVYNSEKAGFEGSIANVVAVDIKKELSILSNLEVVEGKFDPGIENGALVWKEYADAFKWKIGDEISLYLKDVDDNMYPYSFKIMGTLKNKSGEALEKQGTVASLFPTIMVSFDYLWKKIGVDDNATEVSIWDKDEVHADNIKKLANKAGYDFFYAEGGYGVIFGIVDFIDSIGFFIQLVILVILVVASLNLNMMTFFERQKEIGTILSIGGKPRLVVSILALEMAFFSVISFIVALAIFWILSIIFSNGIDFGTLRLAFASERFYMTFIMRSAITAFITIIITIFISSIYPIYLTTKIDPVEVFREGEI